MGRFLWCRNKWHRNLRVSLRVFCDASLPEPRARTIPRHCEPRYGRQPAFWCRLSPLLKQARKVMAGEAISRTIPCHCEPRYGRRPAFWMPALPSGQTSPDGHGWRSNLLTHLPHSGAVSKSPPPHGDGFGGATFPAPKKPPGNRSLPPGRSPHGALAMTVLKPPSRLPRSLRVFSKALLP